MEEVTRSVAACNAVVQRAHKSVWWTVRVLSAELGYGDAPVRTRLLEVLTMFDGPRFIACLDKPFRLISCQRTGDKMTSGSFCLVRLKDQNSRKTVKKS